MSALSKVTRDEYLEKWLVVPLGLPGAAGGTTLTNIATTDLAVAEIPIPRNMTLRGVAASYTSETGTTPALTVKVKRGGAAGTTLASVTASDAATCTVGTQVATFVSRCEILTVTIAGFASDNDFVNPTAVVILCPIFSDENG